MSVQDGFTALRIAAFGGRLEIMSLLLKEFEANVNSRDKVVCPYLIGHTYKVIATILPVLLKGLDCPSQIAYRNDMID